MSNGFKIFVVDADHVQVLAYSQEGFDAFCRKLTHGGFKWGIVREKLESKDGEMETDLIQVAGQWGEVGNCIRAAE